MNPTIRMVPFLLLASSAIAGPPPFNVVEASIPEMRTALEQKRLTSHELVTLYLARIGMYEDKLHCIITVNPNALKEADDRDRERSQGRVRGPLHGIPIALKDNVLTHDIVTTGGALAFDGFVPPYDATLVKNLRDAGAIIIAKTGLSELANWVAGAPTPMPATTTPCAASDTIPTIRAAIRAMAQTTDVPCSRPAAPVPASGRRPISGRAT